MNVFEKESESDDFDDFEVSGDWPDLSEYD